MRYDIARHAAAGGHARAQLLAPETRREIARKAGQYSVTYNNRRSPSKMGSGGGEEWQLTLNV